MQNKRLLHIFFTALLTLGFASCKKGLDLKPTDGILAADYWQTKEQVRAAVIGCYGSLLADPSGTDKPLPEILFLWGELRGDMLSSSLSVTPYELEIMNANTVATNPLVNWRPVYRTINYCNTVIEYAPKALQTDKTFTQAALDGYVAEAKALRALLYFYLVRSFGDVPVKLTPTSNDDEIVAIAKSPQQDVLTQIMADLNDAESKAALTYGSQASDKGRITKYTINTIQADVYLWMDKYTEAAAACDKVINSKKFGMVAASSAWYNTVFRAGNSTESIFEAQYDAQKLNTFYSMFVTNKQFIAANRVMDQVYGTDDLGGTKDYRGDGASVRSSDNLIWKYIGKNGTDLIGASDSYTHWFFYRYPDILLMKAEALAMLNRGAEALTLVYTVRTRANALQATDNAPDPGNVEDVSRFILEERAREFMFEGKRWYDVLRYVKRNNYSRINYLLDMVAGVVPANTVHTTQAKMLDHNSHYFPIYFYELTTNKSLVQNPFYK
ncbi:MAG: RagB/SusD family nutrient uptake outer membrane protein [Bacteroidetes bacterium]|nr:RagB/SusD family nutrient uptake outer membrane protein [Bacteroidota bacterium]